MDLDTGAVISAELQAADQGDTTTMPGTLARAAEHLAAVDAAPTPKAPAELIADRGYHSRAGLKALDGGPWKTRISEPRRDEFSRWHGDDEARRAVYNNRTRLLSGVARQAFKLRAELVERGFALILDRGGMRRVWLRDRARASRGARLRGARLPPDRRGRLDGEAPRGRLRGRLARRHYDGVLRPGRGRRALRRPRASRVGREPRRIPQVVSLGALDIVNFGPTDSVPERYRRPEPTSTTRRSP